MAQDMDKILEQAASSPDEAVRQLAIRRRGIEDEIQSMDTFLTMYAGLYRPEPRKTSVPVVDGTVKSVVPKGGKGKLIDAVIELLTKNQHPMKLPELYEAVKAAYGDRCPATESSFRVRMYENRERVAMVRGEGYWLKTDGDESST